MDEPIDDLADRFSQIADQYDDKHGSKEKPIYDACATLVIEHADPRPDDVVLDLGTGTGLIALALAGDAGHVVGRDISDGMIEQARSKAADGGIENVEFGYGEFRDPQYDGDVDVVVSNFALHHLPDEKKHEAIEAIADLGPRRFVLGDAMFFGSTDPEEPLFGHGIDAATVGMLVDVLTDVGFVVTAVERVHDQVGVLVAERVGGD
ncbi:class I SAM-dependent methyltransferase [Natrialba asiatica]|uniref:Type 12 methyltransferase n=1 Tax=Natrialba asiatica (strain ATCC 700177 / DSM 12278 / JCM 9576 / FERM P-10747 / NBRC 102637 / 172P1) TaxID=29540 RepID=M0B149_NATA1|nr:class I SAM-dependent methyltransferase [Natrialba asiatica]ELZ03419.1 type 12 methyltransferase [Natrialba asiatica DSM 12278]